MVRARSRQASITTSRRPRARPHRLRWSHLRRSDKGDMIGCLSRAGMSTSKTELVKTAVSLVPCHRRQLGHVLQQDASALQVKDAVPAPQLQLAVDAFAGGADKDAELLLRDVHLGPEIGGKRAESAGE